MQITTCLRSRWLFLYIILCLSIARSLEAQVVLKDSEEEYFVTDYEILEDTTKKLTLGEVASHSYDSLFEKNDKSVEINKNRSSAYWLKFKVKNLASDERGWLVEFYDFKIDKMTFFSPNGKGEYIAQQSGDRFPFSFKKFHHKNLEFLIPNNPGKETTFYVRIESEEYVAFIFVLRTYQKFVNYAVKEYYFLGLFYGIILIIGLLNLFIFFTTRDKAHILYVYYVLSLGVFSMTMDGTAFQYLWPNFPILNNYAASVASLSTVIAALLYSKSFLNTHNQLPIFNKIINGAIGVRLIILVYDLIFNLDNLWHPLLDWSTLILPYFAAVISWIMGYNPAKYYVIAFTSVFIGYLIFTLANQGVIPANYFTVYAVNFAVVIEVILLSLALAERIEAFKKEREIAQQEKIAQLERNENL